MPRFRMEIHALEDINDSTARSLRAAKREKRTIVMRILRWHMYLYAFHFEHIHRARHLVQKRMIFRLSCRLRGTATRVDTGQLTNRGKRKVDVTTNLPDVSRVCACVCTRADPSESLCDLKSRVLSR